MQDEPRVLRIGEWRVDPDLDELSRGGQKIRLEPRTMRLLLYLAAQAGRVVDVEQLLNEVWPNVVVTQGSVYQAVAELRRILGDDREHPSYIENLPRRGYRLIARVAPWDLPHSPAPPDGMQAPAASAPTADASIAAAPLPSVSTPPLQPEAPDTQAAPGPRALAAARLRRNTLLAGIGLAVAIVAGIVLEAAWRARRVQVMGARETRKTEVLVTAASFAPSPYSIAVLPFANISGDPNQAYFSDGITEELLNSLTRINELQVAARTSSFSFQGEHPDIATVAHKLNVASVLEGSVRRSGHTVRVTAQLSNAVTGFHIWSQTYDRELGDVLRLQTEIATAVAEALKVKLLGDAAGRIELGGTHNPTAHDAYLRGSKAFGSIEDVSSVQSAIAEFTEAIRLDPSTPWHSPPDLARAPRMLLSSQRGPPSASSSTRHGRTRTRRCSSPRIWLRATWRRHPVSVAGLSISAARLQPTSVRWHSHPAMRRCSPRAVGLPSSWVASRQVWPPDAVRSHSTRSGRGATICWGRH